MIRADQVASLFTFVSLNSVAVKASLETIHGERVGERIAEQLRKLENDLMPLLHRSQKMLHTALSKLERRGTSKNNSLSVNRANQVNIGSAVQNN